MSSAKQLSNFINYPPKRLEKGQHTEYFGIFLSCVCGVFANIVLFGLFAYEAVYILALFSVSGMLLWSLGAYLARRGKFSLAVYVSLFEMCMHVPVIVAVIGTEYGAQMILWSTIAFTTLSTNQKPWVTSSVGIFVAAEIALMYTLFPATTDIRPFLGYEDLFFVAMCMMSAGPLFFVLLRMKSIQIKQRKRLKKQIYNDELTGLYNRHFLYELVEYELEMMKRSRAPFCLCFGDVDFFKKVNDTYGHQVGDEVLIGIADVLSQSLRKSDVVCRWGGEEFVMVLPRCSIEEAPSVVEKIRKTLKDTPLSSQNLAVTMSFGIVKLSNDEPLDAIFKRADDLLYLAKDNGRDRIEVEAS